MVDREYEYRPRSNAIMDYDDFSHFELTNDCWELDNQRLDVFVKSNINIKEKKNRAK